MIKICYKPIITCLLATGLYAGLTPTNIVRGYDGDIDYLAPYVTLDPKSGTLVTIDPRKDQAAAAELKKQHDAKAPNATTEADTTTSASGSTPAAGANTSVTATQAPADTTQKSGSGTAVIAAVGGLVIIGIIVAFTRRKNSAATNRTDA